MAQPSLLDRYASYRDLSATETEGTDFAITLLSRPSEVAILAPHGGQIEPGTSEIAAAIAGDRYALYLFEGLKPDRPHADLHLTSTLFDEPKAVNLVVASTIVLTIHGCIDDDDPYTVHLGGRDKPLATAIAKSLIKTGFDARTEGHRFPATNRENLCNRGRRHMGVQLELPRSLRDAIRADAAKLAAFAAAVASAIAAGLD